MIGLVTAGWLLWPVPSSFGVKLMVTVLPLAACLLCKYYTLRDVNGSEYILLAAWATVTLGIICNGWYYTTAMGGTVADPMFANFDSIRDWNDASALIAGERPLATYGYMVGVLRLICDDVMFVLGFNVACYLLTIVLIGRITSELTADKRTVIISMLMTAMIAYLWAQATTVIKDAPVALCMAVLTLLMVRMRHRKSHTWEYAIGIVALMVLAFIRINAMFMVALMAVVMSFGRGESKAPAVALILPACIAAYFIAKSAGVHTPSPVGLIAVAPNADAVMADRHTAPWDNMLGGDYTALPFYMKLLWLPASVVLQFLLPFPWNFESAYIFGPAKVISRIGLVWYYCGALLLWWLVAKWRQASSTVRRVVACGVILTIITAYLNSGRASRYCLAYLPMLLPASAMACKYLRQPSLRRWLIIFTVLLITALLICYHLHKPWI
ncbi:MAG: hypothetical protein ACI4AM_08055 [Muribaculaceae bacterium]